jgi:hypothetical protein
MDIKQVDTLRLQLFIISVAILVAIYYMDFSRVWLLKYSKRWAAEFENDTQEFVFHQSQSQETFP